MGASLLYLLLTLLAPAPVQPPREQPKVTALITQLAAPDPELRTKAACGLRELGDDAAPALDALVALLSDGAPVEQSACERRWSRWSTDGRTSPGEQAAAALVALGQRTVPPLVQSLKSSSWIARRNAAWALGAIGDSSAVNALLPALKDPEPGVRRQAAWAIGVLSR
jgi:hypothetical protein